MHKVNSSICQLIYTYDSLKFDNGLDVTRVSGFVFRGMLGDKSVAAPVPKQTCAILLPTQESKWCI